MERKHQYSLKVKWTGNLGEGTSSYYSYERSHTVSSERKVDILCSSDPVFRGDKTKYNPEEFLVAALSSCHMLSYLHLCADFGIVVLDYEDNPHGTMTETANGGGHFTNVTLYPTVIVKEEIMIEKANELHEKAHELCFIANSCNFKIHHVPTCKVSGNLN